MRLAILFVLCLYSATLFSQTIPYATQQPKWVFPIYAKDATGKRDTVYLGYHPGTSDVCGDEPQFGEIWRPGTLDFSISTYYWLSPTDSVMKVDIRGGSLGCQLDYFNAKFPVVLYFDEMLLRSDSLPFPIQPVYPRAACYISMGCSCGTYNMYGDYCAVSEIITIADTAFWFCSCPVKDSIVLYDIFGDTTLHSGAINITIEEWNDCYNSIDENEDQAQIKVFPNPANEFLVIETASTAKNLFFNITNVFGQTCLTGEIINNIYIGNLPKGIYFINVNGNSGNEKFIKN